MRPDGSPVYFHVKAPTLAAVFGARVCDPQEHGSTAGFRTGQKHPDFLDSPAEKLLLAARRLV
jgi:hypothetical protein